VARARAGRGPGVEHDGAPRLVEHGLEHQLERRELGGVLADDPQAQLLDVERRRPAILGAPDPAVDDPQRPVGTLLFAALTPPDWDVRFPGDIAELWRAVGMPPRAGFILNVPLRQPVELEPAPPVRAPLRVEGVGSRVMEGVVLGPGDVPISDAFVEIPSLALTARSDTRGRFRFAAVPTTPAKQQLRVRAKAREFPFTIDSSKPPFVLKLDLTKGLDATNHVPHARRLRPHSSHRANPHA